jgi:hypothetical protein
MVNPLKAGTASYASFEPIGTYIVSIDAEKSLKILPLETRPSSEGGVLPSKVTDSRVLQSTNVSPSITLTVSEIVTEVKFSHPKNAILPIVTTPFGITTDVNPEFSNAPSPMPVTLLGIVIEVKLVQCEKA